MKPYKILEVEQLTNSTVRIRTERPDALIIAGQCFNLGLPGGSINREYSMYSDANANYVDFLIKVLADGSLTPALQRVRVGDTVEIDGPYGHFFLHEPQDSNRKYVFLATGTGIAPFHSFVATYPDLRYTLIHGIRKPDEQYDASHYRQGSYIPCISRNVEEQSSMRITDYIKRNPIDPNSIVYMCGNRSMIVDAFEILREQGVPGNNLFTEVFF
jgi:ferredoxin--NADP+ reductase